MVLCGRWVEAEGSGQRQRENLGGPGQNHRWGELATSGDKMKALRAGACLTGVETVET